ncbi:hypothetical protein I6A60_00545 [Frankia sp. AgB1.9]|uniref:hypothetical protein n=1 Tax=unclassified Frankia TaxID=2632575 RepID=UPI001932CC01|nr:MULTISPECIES: hypothetical protein [unclassified Frankia]MBL7487369.1 hypothetical protein [Frankia sp. AgW1.1]MBL7546377.1 hypothetical protein [Frankia sp. AgB1.9]MBL7618578.1 hypothetical protein [Frankia sp. AgB1.8]
MTSYKSRLAEAVEAVTLAAGQDVDRLTGRLAQQLCDAAGIGDDTPDTDDDDDDTPDDPQVWLVVCGSADGVAATMARVVTESAERLAAMATVAASLAGPDRPSLAELGLRVAMMVDDEA